MPEMSWEHTADARAALTAIVSDPEYGVAALSSPRTMSNLLKDLLPDAPKEKTVLVAAAEAGLAETLRDHVAQGMDSATAVRLTASSFSATTSFTPDACDWVAGEFAIALGISESGGSGSPIQVDHANHVNQLTQDVGAIGAPGPVPANGPPDAPAPTFASYPEAPVQYPPAPAQFAPSADQFAPPASQFAPPPGQFAPPADQFAAPAQFSPGSGQFAPGSGQFPPGSGQLAPGPGQYQVPSFQPMAPSQRPKNNNLAIAALVCGIAQFVLWFALLVPGLIAAALALAFGLISMRQVKRTGESGRGMAVTGVVLGALGVLGGIILIVLIIIGAVLGNRTHPR